MLSGWAFKDLGERITYQEGRALVYPTLASCEAAREAVEAWDKLEPHGHVYPGSCQPVQREAKP